MKILIVSDTHRRNENYMKVLDQIGPVDLVVHCGDAEGSEYMLSRKAGCPLEIVLGNSDYCTDLPSEKMFSVGPYRVWLTHGNHYRVNFDNREIKKEAAERGADIVMYGHTHRPVIDNAGKPIAVNPGSLSLPRQEGQKPSYIIMEIDREEKAHFTIHYL